jgi:hypothetical protein
VGIIDADTLRLCSSPVPIFNVRLDHGVVASHHDISYYNRHFRFRVDLKKCYWQINDKPTEQEKETVNEWAKKKFGINLVIHVFQNTFQNIELIKNQIDCLVFNIHFE